jgi:hypothetical protein
MEKKEKITRENISKHLIEYELKIVGKTLLDTVDDDKWYFNFTMTKEQNQNFKIYAIALLKKTFKFTKTKAENVYSWFDLQFGLRIKD